VAVDVIVVDASIVYEVVSQGVHRDVALSTLLTHDDVVTPAILDAEVLGIIKRDQYRGLLDDTGAAVAVNDLLSWPGERFAITPLVERVWHLRANVRVWDAFYVALAEALGAPVITMDQRLARATGPRCEFITLP
jgi:predicted nucleic acid-binding protein